MQKVNLFAVQTATDPEDPDGYRAGGIRLAPRIGAKEIGGSVYDLPPGQSICPYHFEYGSEEWLVVLQGRPILRHREGEGEAEDELGPGDTVCFPPGPTGAHKVTNTTDEPARVLMLSTMPDVDISYYPDSEKFGVWPAAGEGFLVRRASGVEYYDGE